MDPIFAYYGPLAVSVLGNILYNVFAKSTPEKSDTFAFLTIVYLMGMIATFVLYSISSGGGNILVEFGNTNWASYALGLTIVGCDVAIILLYRVGLEISIGTLVANISIALVLVVLGVIFWDESLSGIKIIGVFTCLLGLYIVNKPDARVVGNEKETVS